MVTREQSASLKSDPVILQSSIIAPKNDVPLNLQYKNVQSRIVMPFNRLLINSHESNMHLKNISTLLKSAKRNIQFLNV